MKKIFISYRRQDSAIFTGRVFDRLIQYYGDESVFLDIDSIPSAADFPQVLTASIAQCGVFLAIVGHKWLGDDDQKSGQRRIDDPADFVRRELEQALQKSKPVIPIYFGERLPLVAGELPDTLKPLATANAIEVDVGKDFDHHMTRLRKEVNRYILPSLPQLAFHNFKRFIRRSRWWLLFLFFVSCLVAIYRDPVGRRLMPHSGIHYVVAAADPDIFSHSKSGTYQVARGLANREMLVSETDLVETIRNTKKSFDMFALTGSAIVGNYEAIVSAISNGAKVRLVIFDHGPENSQNLEQFFEYCGTNSSGAAWSKNNADQVVSFIVNLSNRFQEKIEIRLWRGPFMNSMWIRDADLKDNRMGHIEITCYGDLALNPTVRFGQLSPAMIQTLQKQFEYIWNHEATIRVSRP